MTDDIKEESARDEADYLSFMPGQRLKKARELRGLSVEQVAGELHLSARILNAMESDSYKELPEPAFVRGYMRRYAQLVKLSPDDIAGKFDQCYAADQETPEPDARPYNPVQLLGVITRPRLPWRRLLSWGALLFIIVLVLGFLWSGLSGRHSTPSPVEPQAVAPAQTAPPATPAPLAVETAATVATPSVSPEPAVPAAAAPLASSQAAAASGPAMSVLPAPSAPLASSLRTSPPVTAQPSAVVTPPAAPVAVGDVIVITLSAQSWVSVRDASQPLTSGLKPAGQITLKGRAPFYVNIGNAAVAALTLNGRPVDLKPHTQGAVASLTVKP